MINFCEYVSAMNVMTTGNATDKLRWLFKMYDIDGNGFVTVPEMMSVLQAVHELANVRDEKGNAKRIDAATEAAQIVTQMDVNRDERVSIDEFILACLKDERLQKMLSIPLM